MLRSQMQTAVAVSAPGAGTGGQNLDLALVVADGSTKGRADPAYDAHSLPIGELAMAVWEGCTTIGAMQRVVMMQSSVPPRPSANGQYATGLEQLLS